MSHPMLTPPHRRHIPQRAGPSGSDVEWLRLGSSGRGGEMAGQGSAGNVIAALASFFIPGLGQLLQGRLGIAAVQFVLAAVLWFILMGWVIHLWSILDAALYRPRGEVSL